VLFKSIRWGSGQDRHRTSEAYWNEPLRWNRAAEKSGERTLVFCASLSDWLDDEVPIEWLADLLALIAATPHLTWQLLTKRPENWRHRVHSARGSQIGKALDYVAFGGKMMNDWLDGKPPANVWVGATVEDQRRADERIPHLLAIPAAVRFLSCEPLLEAVDLLTTPAGDVLCRCSGCLAHAAAASTPGAARIDWVIVGGESGSRARSFDIDWMRSLIRQCDAAAVPIFCKQLGVNVKCDAHGPACTGKAACIGMYESMEQYQPACNACCAHGNEDGHCLRLRDNHGGDMAEWPADLCRREFPTKS
jgi:protein gp37